MVAAGILAGCGEDDATDRQAVVARPTPKAQLASQLAGFNRALARRDCRQYEPLVLSFSRGRPPGVPAKPAECKGRDVAFEGLVDRRMDGAQQIGTGGLMEGREGRVRTFTLWALDGDGQFRFTNVIGSGRGPKEIGSRFTSRREALLVTKDFVTAVRRKDCAAMEPLLSRRGNRLVVNTGSPRKACEAIIQGDFFAPALRSTPHARIEVLGGTANFAFVGIATRRVYFTLILGDRRRGALRVYDVVPSSPVRFPKR